MSISRWVFRPASLLTADGDRVTPFVPMELFPRIMMHPNSGARHYQQLTGIRAETVVRQR
jgi:hypothetical protein